MPSREPPDPVLAALHELEDVLAETSKRNETARRRADAIRELRERGLSYREIVPMEDRPLIVELLTHTLYDLSTASSNFRKVEARALYSEGLTMAEIAELFGVTRQRIAAILRTDDDGDGSARRRRLRDLGAVVVLVSDAAQGITLFQGVL